MFFKTNSGIRSFTWYINAAVLASFCDRNEIWDLKVMSSLIYIPKNLVLSTFLIKSYEYPDFITRGGQFTSFLFENSM